MRYKPDTLVLLSPAFPGNESETSWVPTQQTFVNSLRQQYPDMRLILLSFYYPRTTEQYRWHGVEVIPFDAGRYKKAGRLLLWVRLWRVLRQLRRQNHLIGLFSFWCGECALLGRWFGRMHGIRHLCWICGQDARETNRLIRFIRPRPEDLIAMSDSVADEFYRSHGIRPAHRIYNAIDPALFPPVNAGPRDIDLLGAGSLSRLKQYDILVMIVGALRPVFPNLRAVICGEGEDRRELEHLIRVQGLQKQVTLSGEQPHREVLLRMQHAKILLHPSSYEGFGVVCLEALYAGARVVSFTQPLHRVIPNWYVVHSIDEMAAKVRELLEEPAQDYSPVLVYRMQDSVDAVMRLFIKTS